MNEKNVPVFFFGKFEIGLNVFLFDETFNQRNET